MSDFILCNNFICFLCLAGKTHRVGLLFTTFGKQIFRSAQQKWFNYQKKVAKKFIDEYGSDSNKKVIYSIGRYGDRASIDVPFSSQSDASKTKAAIDRMIDPKGQSDVNAALKHAVQTMFPKENSLASLQKTLVLFVEDEVKLNEEGRLSARELRNGGVAIIVVVIGSKVNIEGIDEVIGTNGKVIVLRKEDDEAPNILDVIDEVIKKGNRFFMNLFNFLSVRNHKCFKLESDKGR